MCFFKFFSYNLKCTNVIFLFDIIRVSVVQVKDILHKLEAYKTVINLGDISHVASLPISGDQISELTEEIEEGEHNDTESIHTLNVATEDITRDVLNAMITQIEQRAGGVDDEFEDEDEGIESVAMGHDGVGGENVDSQTVLTTPSTQQAKHDTYTDSIQPRDKSLISDMVNRVSTLLSEHKLKNGKYSFNKVPMDIQKEYKWDIVKLMSFIGVGEARSNMKLIDLAMYFNDNIDKLQALIEKNDREIERGNSFVGPRREGLMGGIVVSIVTLNMSPSMCMSM